MDDVGEQPDDQRADRERDQQSGQQLRAAPPSRCARARRRSARPGAAPRGRCSPRTAGTSTSRGPAARKSGTSKPALRRSRLGHALLQQHALDELGLGLVAGAGHLDQAALGELGLDLPRPSWASDTSFSAATSIRHERKLAVGTEPLIDRIVEPQLGQTSGCAALDDRHHSHDQSASADPTVADQARPHLGLRARPTRRSRTGRRDRRRGYVGLRRLRRRSACASGRSRRAPGRRRRLALERILLAPSIS